MSRRRDYGSGSITSAGDGRWRLRVAAGADLLTGNRRTITETYRGGVTDARRRLAELVTLHGGKPPAAGSVTLNRLIDVFLEHGEHARATVTNYDRARSRIPTSMLVAPAEKVEPYDLQRLYKSVLGEHGPYAVHQLHALISGSYKNGIEMRWLTDNPATGRKLPKLPERQNTTPTTAQFRALLAGAPDQQQRLWLRLVLVTGRRRSEVIALRWSDIDIDAATVRIQRSLELDRTVKDTKTGSHEPLAIDPVTVAAVRSWQTAQKERALALGVRLAHDPWLLSDEPDSSLPWRPDLATRRFAKIRARAGVPAGIRLNDQRHANITALIGAGADVRTVAGRAGHDPSMSLGRYSKVVDAANRAAAELIARELDG